MRYVLEPVDQEVQAQPHHINKVPVPGSSLKSKVIFFCEVTLHGAEHHHGQHNRTNRNVQAVEAGGQVEDRAVGVGRERQPVVGLVRRVDRAERAGEAEALRDDRGQLDSQPYGSADARTPNLARLAAEGMRFTNMYAGSSVCAPTRCCLMRAARW